jgi:hypothetical protein
MDHVDDRVESIAIDMFVKDWPLSVITTAKRDFMSMPQHIKCLYYNKALLGFPPHRNIPFLEYHHT